jgi:mevalonate kinase
MTGRDIFSAKILLFGEYSVLLGSPALGIPFPAYTAKLRIPESGGEMTAIQRESNSVLKYLVSEYSSGGSELSDTLDLQRYREEIERGLWLDSDIPRQYGVGSSGALCAALYGRFARNPIVPDETKTILILREIFTRMELYFHGRSSGFDPLVIWSGRAMITGKETGTGPVHLPPGLKAWETEFFLLDTGSPSATAGRVQAFLERFSGNGAGVGEGKRFSSLAKECIAGLLEDREEDFSRAVAELSRFQLEHLPEWIPAAIRPAWKEGTESGLFTLKLCGSGGGGFLLGMTRDVNSATRYFQREGWGIIPFRPAETFHSINHEQKQKNHDIHVDQSAEGNSAHFEGRMGSP